MPTPPAARHLDDPGAGLSPATSHPAYVAAAPDWFWDEGDPRAPFGSDDGHDTLRHVEEYFFDGGTDEAVPGAVIELIDDWALVPEEIWDSSAEEIVAWLAAGEPHIRFLHGEVDAYIAAALAHFKISGEIHPALRFWAERATMLLEHVVDEWEQETFGGGAGRYGERLAAVRTVLDAAPATVVAG
ncbi:MAG TPA: hypothetical protein VGE77_13035 [Nocardioides sp.]